MSKREELKSQGYRIYENDEIAVFWNPNKCQHLGNCVRGISGVFAPMRRPWIDLSQAPAKEIANIIDKCFSKALQYELKNDISVVFEENKNRSAAYKDGNQIGECEFKVSDKIWTIVHTGVRPAYEGQGIAKRLLNKVVEQARKKQIKIIPLCSYAEKVMIGKEEYKEVL